jgi:hypothetical protein
VKKMNRRTLEIEPGTIGYQHIDCAAITRALNAWARRRGITWDNPFRRPLDLSKRKKPRPL